MAMRPDRLVIACVMAGAFSWQARDQPVAAALRQPPSPPQVRMKWQDFSQDSQRVASLARAVKAMRDNDSKPPQSADYRRSWQYWGAMHSYYGGRRGTVQAARTRMQQRNPLFVAFLDGITDLTTPDALAMEVWDQCKHSFFRNNGQEFVQAENFFGWHRMYLYYFERVLRAAAQDDTLRLPYWDYTDPGQLSLPDGFALNENNAPANPALFEARRTAGLNDGSVVVNELLTNIDQALTNPDFLGLNGFSAAIELGVHGGIHCAVGNRCPVPLMGDVTLSANDPIFWLHHANIDRMWECWMQDHGRPAGTWQDEAFTFVDETGTRQNEPVKKWVDPSVPGFKVDYAYDHTSQCGRVPSRRPVMTAAPQGGTANPTANVRVAAANNVAITRAETRVRLSLPDVQSRALRAMPEGERQVELVLNNITMDAAPSTMFNIYLAGDRPADRRLVGTINFFGFAHEDHDAMSRRYDVTEAVRALSAAAPARSVTVVIEATTGVKAAPGRRGAPPRSVTAEVDRRANLRIGSIELRRVP